MLGWGIGVFRQTDGGDCPACADSDKAERIAVWQTGLNGLDWFRQLVKDGRAVDLGGRGYPSRFTAQWKDLWPQIRGGPPHAKEVWSSDPYDIIDYEKWAGKTTIDEALVADLGLDEWVLVEAWDES